MTTGTPIRVGLLLNGWTVPAWVARLIREIRSGDYAEIALCVLNEEKQPRRNLLQRLFARRDHLLYGVYDRIDRRLTGHSLDPSTPVDMQSELSDVEEIGVNPIRKRFVHRFEESDVDRIRAADLDVLLRFGFAIIRGGILDAARHGVWSYHHGDNRTYRGGPPCFWEIYNSDPVTGVTLQVLTEQLDAGRTLCRSFSATHPTSQRRNRKAAYWKAVQFVPRRLSVRPESS